MLPSHVSFYVATTSIVRQDAFIKPDIVLCRRSYNPSLVANQGHNAVLLTLVYSRAPSARVKCLLSSQHVDLY